MSDAAPYSVRDGIAVITMNNPPVNSMSAANRVHVGGALKKADADPAVKAIVLTGSEKAFSGGAEIREFNTEKSRVSPVLPELNDIQDGLKKPLVAAIGGFALGGGLELALGCHYRVAMPKAQLGLPEVKLGLLPGSGGTQRLPRVVPMAEAVRMMTTGTSVSGDKAKQLGLVDDVVQGDLLEGALAFTRELIKLNKGPKRIRDLPAKMEGDPKAFFDAVRAEVKKASRGYPAPLEIVACCEAAATKSFDEGRKFERERFMVLVEGNESKAMRHMFFAERQTAKIPDVPEDTATRPIKSAAVIGAGTMGGGIAMNFANAGIPVSIMDVTQDAVDKGVAKIKANYANTVSKGRLKQEEMDKRMALIRPTTKLEDGKDADIVVEAVFERMDVKQDMFRKLDAVMKPGAILATNTSTLDVNAIAAVTKRPQDVIGTHFFSPANVMRLLEVVRGARTAKDVLATTMKLGKAIKKVAVVSGVCDGFIGNRMIEKYGQQSLFLLDEGCSPQQVDAAAYKWGMAMGPLAMGDMAGLDIGWEIRKRRYVERPNFVYSKVGDKIAELGRFGQKTGKGWYKYNLPDRKPLPDPEVEKIITDYRKEKNIQTRQISDEEIVERLIYALVNEAAYILEEGIALRASDIDMVYLTGYGFPPYRGGPMFYADTVGLKNVLNSILKFQAGYQGEVWKPAPLLVKLANEGRKFND
ncbi:MAG TPA: 3-hydroxyacyl-CoA dehydrogenase NAD-binding domain-containing protein [Burkholderiales bacterium]|nr:3-hydroxyacyl-CoA dehydrogenase NAD-binding domain-containing protein [Burkholderiales bacterium]